MVVTTSGRHLLFQLQIGQTATGKPKLHNQAYQHVDVSATDTAIESVLQAMSPLFGDPVYAVGRVDTVQIQPDATTGGTTTAVASGSAGGTAATA